MNVVLNQFISRVQGAVKARSKSVSLTLDEAQAIVAEITKLTTRDSSILDQVTNIINSSQTLKVSKTDIESGGDVLFLNGGKFSDE